MACCCTNILQLCNVPVCGAGAVIKTGVNAAVDGIHKLVLEFLGVEYTVQADIIATEEIIFPAGELNENYHFTGKIFDPAGAQISIIQGEEPDQITYDCIGFKTVVSYTVNEIAP